MAWPSTSLTRLKPSRSTTTTPMGPLVEARSASAAASARRLNRPVRGSRSAAALRAATWRTCCLWRTSSRAVQASRSSTRSTALVASMPRPLSTTSSTAAPPHSASAATVTTDAAASVLTSGRGCGRRTANRAAATSGQADESSAPCSHGGRATSCRTAAAYARSPVTIMATPRASRAAPRSRDTTTSCTTRARITSSSSCVATEATTVAVSACTSVKAIRQKSRPTATATTPTSASTRGSRPAGPAGRGTSSSTANQPGAARKEMRSPAAGNASTPETDAFSTASTSWPTP